MKRTRRLVAHLISLASVLVCGTWPMASAASTQAVDAAARTEPPPFLLGPPEQSRPVVVGVRFDCQDLNEINDVTETFEFTGVLEASWIDPRQAFDPEVAGTKEKVFQGSYQFNEISASWYPQLVLVNEAGPYQKSGVVLRVAPDGSSILKETVDAVAEAELDLQKFPFDSQRLEIVFAVLGFDRDEVLLQADANSCGPEATSLIRIPQWSVTAAETSVRERPAASAGPKGVRSEFVVTLDVTRNSFYIRRLVTFPLAVIVLLSFSVFWMDRASLGDRISVSFIGILTGVAYQMVMGDTLPRISYFTLMHSFLNLSFITMCGTVVVNLVVGWLDQTGRSDVGDRLDRRCRWAFPLVYLGLVFVMLGVAAEFL